MNCILIIDDEPSIVDVLEELLHDEGYITEHAYSGEEALIKLAEFTPDLVLLDYSLPGMDGIQICSRLRSNERFNSLPVIMLTACSDSINMAASYRSGINDYVLKPFDAADLSTRIEAQLRSQC